MYCSALLFKSIPLCPLFTESKNYLQTSTISQVPILVGIDYKINHTLLGVDLLDFDARS